MTVPPTAVAHGATPSGGIARRAGRRGWRASHLVVAFVALLLGASLPVGSAILSLPGHLWGSVTSWAGFGIRYESRGAVVERLEDLRELTVMRFPVVDVMTGHGFNVEAAWFISGEALVSLDIERAVVERFDPATKELVLTLPPPVIGRVALNMEETKLYHSGKLWPVPMVGDEAALHEDAMRHAEKIIRVAASRYPHHRQSKQNAEAAIRDLFRAAGVAAEIRWTD